MGRHHSTEVKHNKTIPLQEQFARIDSEIVETEWESQSIPFTDIYHTIDSTLGIHLYSSHTTSDQIELT